jgi:hypothetical protein
MTAASRKLIDFENRAVFSVSEFDRERREPTDLWYPPRGDNVMGLWTTQQVTILRQAEL